MDLDAARQTYIAESRELLQSLEDLLLQAEQGKVDAESINGMFRAAHTIKGSAGLFGFDAIVSFTHVVENTLDQVRDGSLALSPPLVALLLECGDHIGTLLTEVAELSRTPDTNILSAGEDLVARLRDALGSSPPTEENESAATGLVQHEAAVETLGGVVVEADSWHISLRFRSDVFRHGMDPMSFIAYLNEVGEVVDVATLVDRVPAAAEMDPESCYLGFEIQLKSDRDKVSIEAVFDFVRDDCKVRILPPHGKLEEFVRLIADLPEDPMRLGEILVKAGALTPRELELALERQRKLSDAAASRAPPLGQIVVDSRFASQPVVTAALEKQKQVEEKRHFESSLLKVHAEKLDKLINLVGELVIAGASAGALAQKSGNAEMLEASSQVARLVEEIRDQTLRLRMVQIGETFGRFPRIARDVAKELGKEIDLKISGADTELDKSMVERIGDPLIHLVRNAVDHGIEPIALRAERGKPAKGTVRLNAYHDSGSIVIEIGDDGGGLNRERIRRKAVDKGLIGADQVLSDAELYKLVLEPGFSTAQQVTNLSGRGVGMDVVKRNIEALRGSIELDSTEGTGTTVRLRLPLTLAIIDGFLVQVADAFYVVPLDMVHECVELGAEARDDTRSRNYINLRGQVLPFLRLRETFECEQPPPPRENIVVVAYGGQRAGLVVDRLLGELQTVIKPLSKLFAHVRGIGGSTILGTGEVALILDVPGLIQSAVAREAQGTGLAGVSRAGSA